jgi:hypothetical protein
MTAPSADYYRQHVRRYAGTTDASLPIEVRPSRSARSLGAPIVASGPRGRCIVVGAGWLEAQRIPRGMVEG